MLSEEFDKKIIEAADRHYPAYNEKAWTKMEKLLDEHLPQEKDDRRRILFFLLLFLLLGGGAWLFFGQSRNGKKQEIPVAARSAENPGGNTVVIPDQKRTVHDITGPTAEVNNNHVAGNTNLKNNTDHLPSYTKNKRPLHIVENKNANPGRTSPMNKTVQVTPEITKKDDAVKTGNPLIPSPKPVEVIAGNEKVNNHPIAAKEEDKKDKVPAVANNNVNTKPTDNVKEETVAVAQNDVSKKTKTRSKKTSSFFISLSAGPDVSTAGTSSPGKMKLVSGGGLGYTYKDRVTLRAGFYNARKIYTASPSDYHPPAAFYSYYPNLQKVDADCRVYEIPVSLSYRFGRSSRQNWFASAGMSSYLMKRETYDYYYKYSPSGPTVNHTRTIYNTNNHYFSVLTLSGGYQRNINKVFSLTAEPYVKLPLGGVGYGKVHLNSTGVLFTVSVKPFQKAKKK